MKPYSLTIKKFITGQHLSTGIRMTFCVIVPAMILYHYGVLGAMMGIPLGALFVGITDQPGPLHHRINAMITAIIINFIVVCLGAVSAGHPMLIGVEVIVLSFLFSMAGVYGPRADAIGVIALIVFIISYGSLPRTENPFIYHALYFAAGGAWYALFSTLTNTIQPYRPAAQLMGEYLIETGHYLEHRSELYARNPDVPALFRKMIPYHITIQQQQTALRELLFRTRVFVKEPTNKGRRLMMIFLESADLLERIVTAQQDYARLHEEFEYSDVLGVFRDNILILSRALVYTGLAVQSDSAYSNAAEIDAALEKSSQAFMELRQQKLGPSNMNSFIRLRQGLYSIEDVSIRIKRLQNFTHRKTEVKREVKTEELTPFTSSQNFNLRLLLSNFSITSVQFRHALKMTIAMTAGTALSFLLPVGHGYWILLTIAAILKPAFSITRKRNMERLIGTFIGIAIAFSLLHFTSSNTYLFVVMIISMLIAYSFLRVNYLVSTCFITLYVVLSFHFFYPAGVGSLLQDRVVDTIAGALIAFPVSYFVLPVWEHRKTGQLLPEAISANAAYFSAVTRLLKQKDPDTVMQYKLARKAAFIAVANISDALQKMLSEPKSKQENLEHYHQLVTANHMLTSYIASLAYLALRYEGKYEAEDFKPMIQYICRQFDALKQQTSAASDDATVSDPFPVSRKLRELLAKRKQELEKSEAREVNETAKNVSMMKTIYDQLQLISATVQDLLKIRQGMKG
ncbi:MAG TPA: FUSC family membrane protein [Chitinophagaceae bacterium]